MKWIGRAAWTLAALALLVWAGAVGFLWANEARLVFRAHATHGVRESLDRAPFSLVRFTSADGIALEGAAIRADALTAGEQVIVRDAPAPEAFWILFCPGAGNSIHFGRVQSQLQQLAAIGYNVFAFDYRGFGRTAGVPTESGLYEDGLAAYRYLTTVLGVPPSRVILAGRSLGSAVAVELATRLPSAGALLLSPIESVPDTGALLYPWVPVRLLATNRFDSGEKIARIRVPVLVVHAINDRLVPIDAARRLFARVTGPKFMLETAGGHTRAGFSPVSELAGALARLWPNRLEPNRLESPASEALAVAGS